MAPGWAHELLDLAWEPHRGRTRIQVGSVDPTAIAVAAWDDGDRNRAPRFRVNFGRDGSPTEWLVTVAEPVDDPYEQMTLAEWRSRA